MDRIDETLIGLLRVNARAPVAELARRVGLSRGAVQNRIDRMVSRGEISGFTVKKTQGEAAAVRAIIGIGIEGDTAPAVIGALKAIVGIDAVHLTNGRWDMIAELSADTLGGFSNTLDDLRRIKGISSSETSLLLKTHRF
jgi:DNA-binding Lrp family transcriptional regulator